MVSMASSSDFRAGAKPPSSPTDVASPRSFKMAASAWKTAEKVLYVKRFLYHYRMNSGSTVNKYTEGTIDILERISRYILKFIKEHGKDERFYQAYNNKSIQLLSQSINSDYAHKNNPKNYLTRRKELKTVLRRKCYRDNFKNINTENIPVTRKLYWSLMKYRMVDLIYLAHWVYRKKIIRRKVL